MPSSLASADNSATAAGERPTYDVTISGQSASTNASTICSRLSTLNADEVKFLKW